MSEDRTAQRRWLWIVLTRLAGAAGAILGIVLLARATGWGTRVLGVAIVMSSLYMMAVVSLALAHRWRSGPAPTPRSWKRRR